MSTTSWEWVSTGDLSLLERSGRSDMEVPFIVLVMIMQFLAFVWSRRATPTAQRGELLLLVTVIASLATGVYFQIDAIVPHQINAQDELSRITANQMLLHDGMVDSWYCGLVAATGSMFLVVMSLRGAPVGLDAWAVSRVAPFAASQIVATIYAFLIITYDARSYVAAGIYIIVASSLWLRGWQALRNGRQRMPRALCVASRVVTLCVCVNGLLLGLLSLGVAWWEHAVPS